MDYKESIEEVKFIMISTPINYNDNTRFFDTSSVEDIIVKVKEMNEPSAFCTEYGTQITNNQGG